MHFDYYIPTKILFGCGRLKELATAALPGKKALIVITNGQSMKRLGYLDKVKQYLKENGVETVLFDKILPNPTLAHVMEAAELARRESCDMVVGLGGGSARAVVLPAHKLYTGPVLPVAVLRARTHDIQLKVRARHCRHGRAAAALCRYYNAGDKGGGVRGYILCACKAALQA